MDTFALPGEAKHSTSIQPWEFEIYTNIYHDNSKQTIIENILKRKGKEILLDEEIPL